MSRAGGRASRDDLRAPRRCTECEVGRRYVDASAHIYLSAGNEKRPAKADLFYKSSGAQERTRTSTMLPPLGPEPSASTNSATWARFACCSAKTAIVAC
ncbi:hypothetical protein F01_190074 [Burkholderia cenocepacia]|nr:hypothetical protein F01_190074 [Burkholderia cenocepacia]